uniref:Major facilitator superfamily domain containing 2B n=1 Tax=Monodelphis domestica TaxID=13616 RepID=H9H8Y1_MONDO
WSLLDLALWTGEEAASGEISHYLGAQGGLLALPPGRGLPSRTWLGTRFGRALTSSQRNRGTQSSGVGRLGVISKLCYGIGGAPNQAASSASAFYLHLFLLDVAGVPAAQASALLFVGKLAGAAADPVAGFIISRSPRTHLGRLKPWILGCSPFLALAYFFLWFLPPIAHLQALWYGASYSLFQALSTLLQVPYSALTMFLTQDQQERDSATAYRMTMEMAGTLIGATVHGLIVAGAHEAPRCPEANVTAPGLSQRTSQLYMIAAGVIAGTFPLCAALLTLGTREEDDASVLGPQSVPFVRGLGHTLRHQPYQRFAASFLLISAAVQKPGPAGGVGPAG